MSADAARSPIQVQHSVQPSYGEQPQDVGLGVGQHQPAASLSTTPVCAHQQRQTRRVQHLDTGAIKDQIAGSSGHGDLQLVAHGADGGGVYTMRQGQANLDARGMGFHSRPPPGGGHMAVAGKAAGLGESGAAAPDSEQR